MKRAFKQLLLLFTIGINHGVYAQITSCNSSTNDFNFSPSTQTKLIDWDKFPQFSLPFKIIYNGPRFNDTQKRPLQHGFSHLASFNNDFYDLPVANRAIITYNTAVVDGKQNWESIRSPWGNNMDLYYSKWAYSIISYGYLFSETSGQQKLNADLFVVDIERQLKSNDSILVLKNQSSTPQAYKNLDNQSFITQYKKDLQNLYATPIKFYKQNGLATNTQVSAYSDSPINANIINVQDFSWQKWKSDASVLNYINYDFSKNTLGGSFYDAQDFLMPSAYYFYDYPHPFAPDYLSYLLFQIESNRAWSNKPIIPFIWLKYSSTNWNNPAAYAKQFIRPWMIEASAIFPFFSGANGLWVWEDPTSFNDNMVYDGYERFINALYRLSKYKDMFLGNYELIIETSARDYVDLRKPIWRGVAKGDDVLIVAHNPYSKDENELSQVTVNYKNWSQTINLKGYEVFLCKYNRSVQANEPANLIENMVVFPNPSNETLQIELNSFNTNTQNIHLLDINGKTFKQESIDLQSGKNYKTLSTSDLPAGKYIIKIGSHSKNFIKN